MLGPAVFAIEGPEELVVTVGQRQLLRTAVTLAVEREGAGLHGRTLGLGCRGPGFDVPVDLLAAVEAEGVEVEGADVRFVLAEFRTGRGVVDLHGAVVAVRGGRSGRGEQQARGHGGRERACGNKRTHGHSIGRRGGGRGGRLSFLRPRGTVKTPQITYATSDIVRPIDSR